MGLLGLRGGGGLRPFGGGRLFNGGMRKRLFNGGGRLFNGGMNRMGGNGGMGPQPIDQNSLRTNTNNNLNANAQPSPPPKPVDTYVPPASTTTPPASTTTPPASTTPNAGNKNVPEGLLAPTQDRNEIESWRQGGRGNCASVACIKAATDAYGKDKVFSGIERTENGGYNVTLQDGRKVSVSPKELEMATAHSGFVEQGKGKDKDFANLAFATMAKNKQDLTGMRSYGQAINSLNDGEDPRAAARWLGIPKDQIQDLTYKDKTGKDSIVAWNNGHAVMVDRREGANGKDAHVYDRFGNEQAYDNRRNIYPSAFGMKPLPETTAPQPNTTNATPAPGPTTTTTTPPPPPNSTNSTPAPTVDRVDRPQPVNDIPTSYTHRDFDKALEAAKQTGRPLVIKGGASWCPPCQAMGKNAFPDPRVQDQLKKNAIFVDVEADHRGDTPEQQAQAKRLLDQLGVSSYPTTMTATVLDRGGQLSAVVNDGKTGGMNADQLSAWLGATLPDAQAIMAKRFGPQQ